MKFLKVLILAVLLPLTAFGQRTNIQDNLSLNSSFRLIPGAAAGRVITSDALGVGTWVAPTSGGDVFLNGSGTTKQNVYTTGTTNDFRGGPIWASILSMNTNTHIYSTIYGANRYAEGGLLIKPVGGTALGGAGFGVVSIVGNTTGNDPELMNLAIYMEGGRGVTYNARGIGYDTGTGVPFEIQDGSAVVKFSLTSSFDATGTNFFGRLGSTEASWIRGSTVTISSNLVINGSTVIGSQASDPVTFNSSTAAIPNGLNFGSGLLMLSNATGTVGINNSTPGNDLSVNVPTTANALADVLIAASAATQIPLVIQGAAGQSANFLTIESSDGTDRLTFSSAFRLTITGGLSSTSTVNGNSFGGNAINGITLKVIAGTAATTNFVTESHASGTQPAWVHMDPADNTAFMVSAQGAVTIGTNGTAIAQSSAGTFPNVDPPSIAANTDWSTNVTVTGVASGSPCVIGSSVYTSGIAPKAISTSANQITIVLYNITTGAIDPANQTLQVRAFNP